MPVDMEIVWDYLIAKKQVQKKDVDKSHGVRPLSTLDPNQEVLFLSPADQCSYVPSTTVDRASTPQSYLINAQGK